MNKRIFFRENVGRTFQANDRTYEVQVISEPSVARSLETKEGVAYSFRPSEPVTPNSAWDFGGALYQICLRYCNKNIDSVAIIAPGFLEELVGYHEVDKLSGFISRD